MSVSLSSRIVDKITCGCLLEIEFPAHPAGRPVNRHCKPFLFKIALDNTKDLKGNKVEINLSFKTRIIIFNGGHLDNAGGRHVARKFMKKGFPINSLHKQCFRSHI